MNVQSDNNYGQCPNCTNHLAKIAHLQNQLNELSNAFAQAVSQLKSSQKLKNQAAELDERFIEQCVREKTQAQAELQKATLQCNDQLAKLKASAQSKINQLNQQISHLTQQAMSYEQKVNEQNQKNSELQHAMTQLRAQANQKIQALNANAQTQQSVLNNRIQQLEQMVSQKAQSDQQYQQQLIQLKQRYEQKINQNNTQIYGQQQELEKLKTELAQANEEIAAKARLASRAEELNARLLEQCRMAKLGADTVVNDTAKAFKDSYAKLKTEATDKLGMAAEQNMKIKTAAQQALQKANQRIKILEQTISNLQNTASMIEPNLRSVDFSFSE